MVPHIGLALGKYSAEPRLLLLFLNKLWNQVPAFSEPHRSSLLSRTSLSHACNNAAICFESLSQIGYCHLHCLEGMLSTSSCAIVKTRIEDPCLCIAPTALVPLPGSPQTMLRAFNRKQGHVQGAIRCHAGARTLWRYG